MDFNIKKLFFKKSKNINSNNYKYDDIIEHQIKLNNKIKKDVYEVGNYKVNRKIPTKEELNKIYQNFMKNKNICVTKEKYNFEKKIEYLKINYDNEYILINLNLIKYKRYKLSITFTLNCHSNIAFILNNNHNSRIFRYANLKGNLMFNTNCSSLSNYNELYILFDKNNIKYINDFLLSIHEINNNKDYDIFLLKCNNKVIIY